MARVTIKVVLDVPDELLEGLDRDQKIEEICSHDMFEEFLEHIDDWEF